ncbi:hypothetical protein [Micromonospora sp. KC213]|uniref:hypothetical protein n=1 Tax=Micromonospora sp. KC213 TaxID=2530378 RepID=UPI00104EED27|nr:hypothetical protein [Micromonospora sp. KC213]TDC43832.1 hypothetical protein E1166_02225 [Micromonospora sp. KC213]
MLLFGLLLVAAVTVPIPAGARADTVDVVAGGSVAVGVSGRVSGMHVVAGDWDRISAQGRSLTTNFNILIFSRCERGTVPPYLALSHFAQGSGY